MVFVPDDQQLVGQRKNHAEVQIRPTTLLQIRLSLITFNTSRRPAGDVVFFLVVDVIVVFVFEKKEKMKKKNNNNKKIVSQ